jgi:tetratricopeptide (TPR) repeat protein
MDQSPNAARKPASRRPTLRSLFWWTFWLLLASSAVAWLPYEVGYWMLALAEQASQQGRTEEALSWVEQAKPWLPESELPFLVQANTLARGERKDPLFALEAMLKTDPPNKIKAALLVKKSQIHKEQGDYEKSLKAFDQAADFVGSLRPSTDRLEILLLAARRDEAKRELSQVIKDWEARGVESSQVDNTLAYFSALLNDKVDEALKRVGIALTEKPDEPAYLDTRGYIFYRLGKHEQALADLEKSVELMEKSYGQSNHPEAKKALAVIVYHRSLVLEALEKSAEAERDRARVKELGFEPNERLF